MGEHRDISGCTVFSAGDLGRAHVLAHALLDRGAHGLGHRLLGDQLARQTGSGTRWVHLQWHMLVFELAIGQWRPARDRFDAHIAPAISRGDAATDGPAALWRLYLASEGAAALPWREARGPALRGLGSTRDPFVALHHLLALAGARDAHAVSGWIARDAARHGEGMRPLAEGLLACARRDWAAAATALDRGLPAVETLGGSHAQNDLFASLQAFAAARAGEPCAAGAH